MKILSLLVLRFQVKLIHTAIFVKKKVKKKIFFAWFSQK